MKNKRVLVSAVLGLVIVALLGPQSSTAKAIMSEYTGIETVIGTIYPGDMQVLPTGRVLIRNKNIRAVEAADDPRVSGASTLVINDKHDESNTGPIWGTIEIAVPDSEECQGGGVWQGRWVGKLCISESYVYWHGVMKGVSGCVEGLSARFESDVCIPNEPCSYSGTILEAKGGWNLPVP